MIYPRNCISTRVHICRVDFSVFKVWETLIKKFAKSFTRFKLKLTHLNWFLLKLVII